MFLEIHTDRRRKNAYSYGLFRETFRDNGQVRHRTRGRVTGLSDEQLLAMRDFVRRGCPEPGEAACEVLDSREWGASWAVLATAKALGLPKLLYSRAEPWPGGLGRLPAQGPGGRRRSPASGSHRT